MPAADLIPCSPAGHAAHRRLACPAHGLLPAQNAGACLLCRTSPYDIDDADDKNILRSLRGVARSARMIRARLVGYPMALVVLAALLSLSSLTYLLTPVLGEPLARLIERVLRQFQPEPLRALDRELLARNG